MLTKHVTVRIEDLKPGDVIRFKDDPVWVTVERVKGDRFGFDLLYSPFNQAPRWRGFDKGDKVTRKETN